MTHRLQSFILLLLSIFLFSSPAFAAEWSVSWQGAPLHLSPPAVEWEDRVYVPLRPLAEKTGTTITWDGDQQRATLERQGKKAELRIYHTIAYLDGEPSFLEVPPTLIGGQPYIPLRFFAIALGLDLTVHEPQILLAEKSVAAAADEQPDLASRVLSQIFTPLPPLDPPLTLQLGERRWAVHPQDFDLVYFPVEEMKNRLSHDGWGKALLLRHGEEKLRALLQKISTEVREKTKGVQDIDIDQAIATISQNWLTGSFTPIQLATIHLREELGAYTTHFDSGQVNRSINLRLAAGAFNGYRVEPGGVFSFNQAVGERTYEGGYRNALVIEGDRFVSGIGGGICQTSSTLYNAVEKSGLEIVERHTHSLTIGYVPRGRDATVAWGSLDFQFRNNLDRPIALSSEIDGGTLTVHISKINRDV